MPGKLNALLSLVLALVLFKPLPAIVADEHKIVQTLPLSPKDSHIPRVVAEKRTEIFQNGTKNSDEYVDDSSDSDSEEVTELVGLNTTPPSSFNSTSTATTSKPEPPIKLLTQEERRRLVNIRGVPKGHKWTIKNNQHIRSVKVEEEADNETSTATNSNVTKVGNFGVGKPKNSTTIVSAGALRAMIGAAKGNFRKNGMKLAKGTKKRLYNVVRAKPKDSVDPDGYNFFQFRPDSSLGWLWLTQKKIATVEAKLDLLGSDQGLDADFNDPANLYDWEFRRYDRACLHVEYLRQKNFCEVPVIDEEVKRLVDVQNEKLARRYLDWQFVNKESADSIAVQDKGEQHPLFTTYKFLNITMEIFRDKICRNATSYPIAAHAQAPAPANLYKKTLANANAAESKLLPRDFIEEIYRLFLTLRDITLPKNIPDYPDKADKDDILEDILLKCALEEDSIPWYSHSCGDQVLAEDTHNNFACTPLVDYDFNTKIYDPILDGMWHMFTGVHAYCFKYFNHLNPRLWHRYALIMTNAFTLGMRQRWTASVASPKFYVRLLGPDYAVHLETMNRCMFGATLRSDFPAVIPRFDSRSTITFGQDRTVHKDGAAG